MRKHRWVVGVDGSTGSLCALRWAVHEAHLHGGTVHALMAYDWAGTEAALLAGLGPEGERRRAEEILEAAVTEVRREYADVPISAEALLGKPALKLVEAATEADLLVVGSRGHSHLRQAVLGSVSEACIRHARCPVVVVPTPPPWPVSAGHNARATVAS
ncbi:MAG: universal stress protein [Hamadaea sp.]|nr:universal stress protein [Hamadaea sp.]